MKITPVFAVIAIFSLLVVGCQTIAPREPIASDDNLTGRIIGAWVRDERYTYGRFIGTLVLYPDGSGARKFDIVSANQTGAASLVLEPLVFETFRWHIEAGYIVFTDRRVTDLDPQSSERNQTKACTEHREFIAFLSAFAMKTVDPLGKTDTYQRADAYH